MPEAYQQLVDRFQKIYRLQHLGSIAQWDQSAMMPAGGNQARSEALAELHTVLHNLLADPQVGDWLEESESQSPDEQTQASLREMKREYFNATALPESLVKAKTLASSKCEHAWRSQRPENDWAGFSSNLKEVVTLAREEASLRAEKTGSGLYDALINIYEPGMNSAQLDHLFGDMKIWLPGFIQEAAERQKNNQPQPPVGPFSEANQKALGLDVMKLLGFDFNHGRLDVSTHPFCGGVSEDVRLTTRYKSDDFIEALMGTIHETGHGRYEQNRSLANRGLPVGSYRSMGIHESQSLFFEMQIGRSPEFLSLLQPLIVKHLCNGNSKGFAELDNLQRIYTRVRPGKIRVEADEITYPAHVILRYEIEQALIEGSVEVDDIPELWNLKMKEYLNIDINNYADGCMQDIHWPMAAFGYFPSYTLGAIYAAQLFAALKQQHPDIEQQIRNNNLDKVFIWLKENIWSKGAFYTTEELITQATGEPLSGKYLKNHLKQRYLT